MNLSLESSKDEFLKCLSESVENFRNNKLLVKLRDKSLTMKDYHNYLHCILHQTLNSSISFSLAGVNCTFKHVNIQQYLMKHAEEEMDHWRWVVDDLKSTGYVGPDPLHLFPPLDCQAYIAFNFYIAQRYPIARLGIAAMLESIGANYGKQAAISIQKTLNLREDQLKFLYGHGDTDVGHSQEILDVLDAGNLTPSEWGVLRYSIQVSFELYNRMLESALK